MEVQGKLLKIDDIQTIKYNDKEFKKRNIVVETDEKYPQKLSIEFSGDKTVIFGGFKVGDDVNVGINLRGREYKDKKSGELRYFNSIAGWRIEKADANAKVAQAKEEDPDDLPF